MNHVPARLAHVHRLLLEHAFQQTNGDWSRVEARSATDLHIRNKPIVEATAKKPAVKKPAAKKPATKPEPAPQKPLLRDPGPVHEYVPRVYEQRLVPRESTLPKHLTDPVVRPRRERPASRPEQAVLQHKVASVEPKTSTPTVRDRLSEAERQATEAMRAPLQKTDRPVPPEFDIRQAWEQLDVEAVATSILAACRAGLPESLPLDMHAEVLALEGIDLELVAASVRNPNQVEIAGAETVAKGYPVLRFFRGDVTTVVGLRNTRLPIVIATYALSRLDHDRHRVGSMKGGTGGGGARKVQGLPHTPAQVAKRLRQMGAEVAVNELSDEAAPVIFRGQELGKISPRGTKEQCESDYQRVIRKMEAIARRG